MNIIRIYIKCSSIWVPAEFSQKRLILLFLSRVTCSDSELTSETLNRFGHSDRSPWAGDRPIARILPTYVRKRRNRWDSNPRSQSSSGIKPYVPKSADGYSEFLFYINVQSMRMYLTANENIRFDVSTTNTWRVKNGEKYRTKIYISVKFNHDLFVMYLWNLWKGSVKITFMLRWSSTCATLV
jgi:hypothetical protein